MIEIESRLKRDIIENCINTDGKLKLTCSAAFQIAEKQGVNLLDITKICNRHSIKVCKCQLGCFK
jgi:hypothetical protein